MTGLSLQNTSTDIPKKSLTNKIPKKITPNINKESITKARTFLGNMNFTKEEMMDDINLLSGGSKAKLFLVKLLLLALLRLRFL